MAKQRETQREGWRWNWFERLWDHPEKSKWLSVLTLRKHEGTCLALFQMIPACHSLRYHQNDLKATYAEKSFWWQLRNLLSVRQDSLRWPNKQFQGIARGEFILTCFYFVGAFQVLLVNYKGTNVSHQARRRNGGINIIQTQNTKASLEIKYL